VVNLPAKFEVFSSNRTQDK